MKIASLVLVFAVVICVVTGAGASEPLPMAPYIVKTDRVAKGPAHFLEEIEAQLDALMPAQFVPIPNGPLVQDIVWRHRYLTEDPGERAVIVTDFRKTGSLISATTFYTERGVRRLDSPILGVLDLPAAAQGRIPRRWLRCMTRWWRARPPVSDRRPAIPTPSPKACEATTWKCRPGAPTWAFVRWTSRPRWTTGCIRSARRGEAKR
jgi:hypothetical protein